ncbi:hypothetical protein LguiA_002911 [Lonicera macranthoides]
MSQVPDSHILYVGNLSPKVDEAAVRRFFRHYGDIVSIQFFRKEFIFCNVSFARKEDAERALRLKDKKRLAGRHVCCRIKIEKKKAEEVIDHFIMEQVIIAENKFDQVQNMIQKKYQNCGNVIEVYVPDYLVDHDNKGWAVIRLDTEEAVNNALNLDGCVRAPPYPKRPFLTRPGGGRYAFLNALMNDERAQQSRRFDASDAAFKAALEGGCNASCDLCR